MTGHRAIIEAGPGTIRRLCCRTDTVTDHATSERSRAALDGIDDPVALVGERPVAVDSLWSAALGSALGDGPDIHNAPVLVHPSWWSSSRVGVLVGAAATVSGEVRARPRSWLLARASDAVPEATAVVEIAERLVAITGAGGIVALPRGSGPHPLAGEVARAVAGLAAAVVVIDATSTIAGAPALATAIADAVRGRARKVVQIDDARLAGLAESARPASPAPAEPSQPRRTARGPGFRPGSRVLGGLGAAALVLAGAAPAVVSGGGRGATERVETAPTTFLVEGRVALTVPANWPTQRVLAGPGSARVQVTSPSDPEVALHITQSPVANETLGGTADRLRRAIDAAPAGVFVDFNPSGVSAGRPAVTYREVRAGHHVRWTVLVDGPVRISVGCQSRPGDEDAVRGVCEQAVRSAHALG